MAAQLPAQLHEERLEGERRAQVELLEGAPGLANELAGALRADEVAVPGCELFQRGEQLLPFGAAGGPADSLLGFAGREVEQLEPLLRFQLRLGATLFRAVEDALRGLAGLELR